MTLQKGANLMHYYVEKQVFSWRAKNSYILCILHGKAGVLKTRQIGENLLHYYVSKQGFSWRAKKVQICCIITCKSRFSHDVPKRCKFVALLRRKAGFLMTRQNLLYFMRYYVEKQVFSRHDKRSKFVALLRFEAGFLMKHQKLLYLMHYYVEKQVFSWHAKNVQICCIITWKTRFCHNVPKTFIFDVLLRGKAGFLMTRQKGANLLHYYVEKQVFSWHAKKEQICCIIMFRSRISHEAPKTLIFDALLRGKAGFLMTRQKGTNWLHYYVEKQVFSWRAKNSYIWCIIT